MEEIAALGENNNSTEHTYHLKNFHKIAFTYSVKFVESEMAWAHRLDHYVKTGDEKIHYR